MKSSIKIGSIMGIPIYLHYSFLLILPFLAWSFGNNIKSLAGYAEVPVHHLEYSPYVWGFLIALALFGSVLLHELGHSYIALKKQVKIRGITLMIMGGVAQLEEMPTRPGEEAQIALAGPVVSLLVGAGAYLMLPFLGNTHPNLVFSFSYLGYINIFLALFNLLPAFPMDGGRILRSLLAKRKPFMTATRIAADIGKIFAFAFGIFGLLNGNFVLILIAFFVYMGASQEYHYTVLKTTLDGFQVRDLMNINVITVEAHSTVTDLIDRMTRERHHGYPVVRNGELAGCVTLEDLEKLPPNERQSASVSDIMSTDIISVAPNDDIYLALRRMSENEIGRLPVLDNGRLVGILSRSDIMRGFQLRQLQSRLS